tara:strand:- start:625 stop:828 length:204 start_codon:yes stop_codon:yes gene_type:complete
MINLIWAILGGSFVALGATVGILRNQIVSLNPEAPFYQSFVECVKKENLNCSKKYIRVYQPEGGAHD